MAHVFLRKDEVEQLFDLEGLSADSVYIGNITEQNNIAFEVYNGDTEKVVFVTAEFVRDHLNPRVCTIKTEVNGEEG